MIPKMLNWIEVWGLSWPWHDIESMGLKPLLGLFASVLWIIVLLENNTLGVFVVKLQAWLKVTLQNLSVEVSIHIPINPSSKSRPFPQHTAPNHEWSIYVPWTSLSERPSPGFFQTHFLPSDPKWLTLVSSDQTTLFQSSIVQYWCARAKSRHACWCFFLSKGFFYFTTAF